MQSEQTVGLLVATQLDGVETCGAACRALLDGLQLPPSTPAYAAKLHRCDDQTPVDGPIVCVVSHSGLSLHNFEATLSSQPKPDRMRQCVTAMMTLEASLEDANQHNAKLEDELVQSDDAAKQAQRELSAARKRIESLEYTVAELQRNDGSILADHSQHEQARRQEAMWRGRLAEVQRGHDQVVNSLMEQLAMTATPHRLPAGRERTHRSPSNSPALTPRQQMPPRVPHLKLSSGGVLRPAGGSPSAPHSPERSSGSGVPHSTGLHRYGNPRQTVNVAPPNRGSLTPRGTSPRLTETTYYDSMRADSRGTITPRGTSPQVVQAGREASSRAFGSQPTSPKLSSSSGVVHLQQGALVKPRDSRAYTSSTPVDRGVEDRAKRLHEWRALRGPTSQGRMSVSSNNSADRTGQTVRQTGQRSQAPTSVSRPRWAF